MRFNVVEYKTVKPMRKSSKHSSEITESGGWWDLRMEQIAEWTFEGGPKFLKSRRRREPNPLSIRSA